MCETETKTEVVQKFETETCGRCGGTGNYSYCQMYGTTCFKCRGAKRIYTKRGAAARKFFDDSCMVKASEVKVGDLLLCESYGTKSGFQMVTAVGNDDGCRWLDKETNEWKPYYTIECAKYSYRLNTFPDSMVRLGQNAEDKAAKLQAAYEYQTTLTKLGKPRKSK